MDLLNKRGESSIVLWLEDLLTTTAHLNSLSYQCHFVERLSSVFDWRSVVVICCGVIIRLLFYIYLHCVLFIQSEKLVQPLHHWRHSVEKYLLYPIEPRSGFLCGQHQADLQCVAASPFQPAMVYQLPNQ